MMKKGGKNGKVGLEGMMTDVKRGFQIFPSLFLFIPLAKPYKHKNHTSKV